MTAAPPETGSLPRRIGLWSAVAIVVGSTIGSGIFRSPAGIADRLPGPLPLLSIWVMGGVFALCGALSLAEIASAIPRTGGLFAFLRDGWGRLGRRLGRRSMPLAPPEVPRRRNQHHHSNDAGAIHARILGRG